MESEKEKVSNNHLLPCDIPEWIYEIYSVQVGVEKNEENNAVVTITIMEQEFHLIH